MVYLKLSQLYAFSSDICPSPPPPFFSPRTSPFFPSESATISFTFYRIISFYFFLTFHSFSSVPWLVSVNHSNVYLVLVVFFISLCQYFLSTVHLIHTHTPFLSSLIPYIVDPLEFPLPFLPLPLSLSVSRFQRVPSQEKLTFTLISFASIMNTKHPASQFMQIIFFTNNDILYTVAFRSLLEIGAFFFSK